MYVSRSDYQGLSRQRIERVYDKSPISSDEAALFMRSFSDSPNYKGDLLFPPMDNSTNKNCCPTFIGMPNLGKPIEWDEWILSDAVITESSRVLEFGARYGTTSCILSRKTGNSGNVISVEIDSSVWSNLIDNRDKHHCNFHIVKGSVGDKPLLKAGGGEYDTFTKVAAENELKNEELIAAFDFQAIERHVGFKINTLLIDCEGCVDAIFSGKTAKLLDQVSLILIEEDNPRFVKGGYEAFFALLLSKGFKRVWNIQDSFSKSEEWSYSLHHSIWSKGINVETCENYATRKQFGRDILTCLPL